MKHDYRKMLRRLVGFRLAWYIDFGADLASTLQNYIDERVNDPAKVERKLQDLADQALARRRKANRDSVYAAAEVGELVFEEKRTHGGGAGWVAYLAGQRLSRPTAYNRMALYLFQRSFPDLFERFAVLGVTKCLRVAMLPPNVVQSLSPQTVVQLPYGKKTALEYLTDDQLVEYFKTLCPPACRPRRKVLRLALKAAERAVSNDLYPREPLARADVEAARDTAQRVVNRLNESLRTG
jgi:hypothetical protein